MRESEENEADDRIDPAAPFFIMFVDLDNEGKLVEKDIGNGNMIAREIELLESEAADNANDGCTAYIYRCVPVRRYTPITQYRVEELGRAPKARRSGK